LIVPLAATDFMPVGAVPVRAGGLSALILAWILVSAGARPEGSGLMLREGLALLAVSLLSGLAFSALGSSLSLENCARGSALTLGFLLLLGVFRGLLMQAERASEQEFFAWMRAARAAAPKPSLKTWQIPLLSAHRLLSPLSSPISSPRSWPVPSGRSARFAAGTNSSRRCPGNAAGAGIGRGLAGAPAAPRHGPGLPAQGRPAALRPFFPSPPRPVSRPFQALDVVRRLFELSERP